MSENIVVTNRNEEAEAMPSPEMREQFPLETRTVQTGEQRTEFKVRVIDRADKWEPATNFCFTERVHPRNSNRALNLKLRGLSYSEWMEIELRHQAPEEPEGTSIEEREKYEAAVSLNSQRRYVEVLEVSTGKKVPGNTIDEKVEWMNSSLGVGDDEALFERILSNCSALGDGSLIDTYKNLMEDNDNVEIVEFNDFLDLAKLSEQSPPLPIQRPFDDFLVEFPLKQISGKVKNEIDDATKQPVPPGKPGKNLLTGKPDMNNVEYNYQDPGYKRALRANERKRTVMLLEAGLSFEIPGDTIDKKFEWIGGRLFGDVVKVRRHIEGNVGKYSRKFNFFTIG